MKSVTSFSQKGFSLLSENDSKIYERLLKIVLVVYPLLFIWQGIDYRDFGYFVTNYNLIFSSPNSIINGFGFSGMWLTSIIGGLWLLIFGWLGVAGIKLGCTLICYAIMYISYRLLKDYYNHTYILVSFFIVFTIIQAQNNNCIDYNFITVLFNVITISFLFSGVKSDKKYYFLLAGILSGLNIFVRLPNILFVSIILLVFVYDQFNSSKFKKQVIWFGFYSVGVLISVGFVVALMVALKHDHYFLASLKQLLFINHNDPDSAYSTTSLLATYPYQLSFLLMSAWKQIIALVLIIIISSIIFNVSKKSAYFKHTAIIFFAATLSFVVLIGASFLNLIGILLMVLTIYIIVQFKNRDELYFLVLCSFFMVNTIHLGSNNGIRNAIFGLWLVFPVFLSIILEIKESDLAAKIHFRFYESLRPFLNRYFNSIKTVIVVLLVLRFVYLCYRVYGEEDQLDIRLKLMYPVRSEKLCGVLTTKERAEDLSEVLVILKPVVRAGDYLFIYHSNPLLHYLTDTKPYLNNPWPWTYTKYAFKQAIARAKLDNIKNPVTVIDKQKYWNGQDKPGEPEILADFLATNKYKVLWENRGYTVLVPDSTVW